MNDSRLESLKQKSVLWRSDRPQQRVERLMKIKTWIKKNEELILKALYADFKKPAFETSLSEIMPTLSELKHITSNLASWMSEKKVPTPMTLLGHASWIRYENKGVVLIIAPWNYPFQLAIIPLITALAAGNTVVLKPSELTPHTSDLLKKLVEDCFVQDEVVVELGDKEKSTELLEYAFDHVFFTGSTPVGRIVAKACAEKLIPCTLELGGKSPTIVDQTANLQVAAEKIFWGKFLNRGQTCVAPDYVLVHKKVAEKFRNKLTALIQTHKKDEQGAIISVAHSERLQTLAQTTSNFSNSVLELVQNPTEQNKVMHEEIFGPVLPILTYETETELFAQVRKHDKPLSLYIFSEDQKMIARTLNALPSGGAGINSVIVHLANHNLPFGGIGPSGHGQYHGYFGFLELSHQRAVIQQSYFSFLRKIMQPPYTPLKKKLLKWL